MVKGRFVFNENKDGSIRISYEDYGVEAFDGSDYEVIYTLDMKNAHKLRKLLSENHQGSLEEMIRMEFGECLDKKSFASYCSENDIEQDCFTWIS